LAPCLTAGFVAAFGSVSLAALAASPAPTRDELVRARRWTSEHLRRAKTGAPPPFSFVYGGRRSEELLPGWRFVESSEKLDAQRTRRTQTYTDPATGLEVRCVIVEYNDYPAVEWTIYLRNAGTADTPILGDIQALNIAVRRGAEGEFLLHHSVGSLCQANDYQPLETPLGPGADVRIAGAGGRPTNSDMCYFNVEWPNEGLIIVLGWPGQWAGRFLREGADGLRITAGQELTHFVLHPGEEVRTPLVVLQFWQGGDWLRAQNTWRRFFIAHNIRRPGGELPWTQWCGASDTGMMVDATEENQKAAVDAYMARNLHPDFWWMDAGWYDCHGDWTCTGTWRPDPVRFPNGLRPVTDYLHERGIRSILWFEPERVRAGTWLATEHPEWILPGGEGLLNLGDPDAWHWLVTHVDRLITEFNLDIYRQDFNMDPLGHWRAHDTEDRQGITENRYVTGLLAYWDELLRRHPKMLYDNCASGGRRNDLESMRRGVPYTKSDYADDPVGVQGETYGISLWLPYFAATWGQTDDVYLTRSREAQAVGACLKPTVEGHFRDLPKRLDEWRRIVPCYWGDFWPLTPYSLDNTAWIAWQFDLPETGKGVVQAFRRAECPTEALRVQLRGLDPRARYTLTNLDVPEPQEMTGKELMTAGLQLTAAQAPTALVVCYERRR